MNMKRQLSVILTCSQCQIKFTRQASYVRNKSQRNLTGNLYCSPECARLARWGEKRTIEVHCVRCGKIVKKEKNQLKNRGKYGPFCSHQCYGKWRTENLDGEDSPNWKGGYTLDYGGSHWKRQRRLACKRDNYTCQDCGNTKQSHGYLMDVHHIIPYDMFDDPEMANKLDNLITLCRQCHTSRHKEIDKT